MGVLGQHTDKKVDRYTSHKTCIPVHLHMYLFTYSLIFSFSILFFDTGKDHTTSRSLQNLGDDDFLILTDVVMSIFHNDHRAIVHVTYTLTELLAFLENVQGHAFAGEDNGFDRIRKFIDVQDRHALQLGDAIEIVIIRQDRTLQLSRQNHKFIIHLTHAF